MVGALSVYPVAGWKGCSVFVVPGDRAMAMPWWGRPLIATGVVLPWILIRKRMHGFS
jgi:hypothetical protein